MAHAYEREGADEIVFLDITASAEVRATLLDVARRTAEALFIPLTIGGGIRSVDDVSRALRAGADKVAVNSAAVARPALITEAARQFGSQCVVASIDARRNARGWEVFVHGARRATGLDAVEWARECATLGAGEILLTSIDRDGARTGYDLELTRTIAEVVNIPVIASGGAGQASDIPTVILAGGADAVLVAGILHDGLTTVREIKDAMKASAIPVRDCWTSAAPATEAV